MRDLRIAQAAIDASYNRASDELDAHLSPWSAKKFIERTERKAVARSLHLVTAIW